MTKSTDKLTRVANRQNMRATGDVLFGLLYVGVGLGNLVVLLTL